jgi:hypothetical protein
MLLSLLFSWLLSSGCASPGGTYASEGTPGVEVDTSVVPADGIHFGWMDYRAAKKAGQVLSLTLVSENSKEGKLLASGRARMEGGKVVSDRDAAIVMAAFEEQGFQRFALKVNPNEAPAGALQSVWMRKDGEFETLYLMPGAVQNPETKDLPRTFQALKELIRQVHLSSPGSSVSTGDGWSGDDLLNQKVDGRPR